MQPTNQTDTTTQFTNIENKAYVLYKMLLSSGHFFEFHPELSGSWKQDKETWMYYYNSGRVRP